MNVIYKQFVTKEIKFSEIVDSIFNDLISSTKNIKIIKIKINFISNNEINSQYFLYKQKIQDIDKYKYRNFFYRNYRKYLNKYYKNQKIDSFIIEISYIY